MAISELPGLSSRIGLSDQERRQLMTVTYRLKGERIKAALISNPGAIILSPRQSGKTTSLLEYVCENHPEGVVIFVANEAMAYEVKDKWDEEHFKKSILAWGNSDVYRWQSLPIFADDFCTLGGTTQKQILRHPHFLGAVSSPHWAAEEETKKRCILY